MRARLIGLFFAVLYLCIGLVHVLNPVWWLRPLRNPYAPEGFVLPGRIAFWYRLDALSQSLRRGRPLPLARPRWMEGAAALAEALPDGAVTAVPVFHLDTDPIERLIEDHIRAQRPVVLRGAMARFTELERWGFERLLQEHGEHPVRLSCPARADYGGRLRELDVPGVYLHNSEALFHAHPSLAADLGIDRLAQAVRGPLRFAGVLQLFMGRKKTGSRYHCAPTQNFFLMLDGKKKWTFIDPSWSPLMSPHHLGGDTVYWRSEAAEQTQVFQDMVAHLSPADRAAVAEGMAGPHRDRVEAMFRKCPRQEVVLEPGDVLFVPMWSWHEVENVTDTSVAVATRWFDPGMWTTPNGDLEAILMLRPGPAYRSSIPAFEERLLTLDGALVADPVPAQAAADVEDATRSGDYTGMEGQEEAVHAYDARHGFGTLRGDHERARVA